MRNHADAQRREKLWALAATAAAAPMICIAAEIIFGREKNP